LWPELRLTTTKGCSAKLSPPGSRHCSRALRLSDSLADSLRPRLMMLLSSPVPSRWVVELVLMSSMRALRVAFSARL